MEYISSRDAAVKWGVSLRYVQRLLHENRINGAKKFGVSWLVPANAEKPRDPRKSNSQTSLRYTLFSPIELPKNHAAYNIDKLSEKYRDIFTADFEYRKGNPEPAMSIWKAADKSSNQMLSTACVATVAAISKGDFEVYHEIQNYINSLVLKTHNEHEKAMLSLPQALAGVSMKAINMTPKWLVDGDFSMFPKKTHPFLLYLYTLHLNNTGNKTAAFYTAKASLVLNCQPNTFTWIDLYNTVLCAYASYDLGNAPLAEKYLTSAMQLGLPYGMIIPFADYAGTFGGMIDRCIQRHFSQYEEQIFQLWDRSFKNWMEFHNKFAGENITTILTAREYQLARLIAKGASYAQASQQMHLSVGRAKNILNTVYEKLCINKRSQLSEFII